MYLCLCTEIIYCEKKLGAGFFWSWRLPRAASGAGESCRHPGQPKGPWRGVALGAGSTPWMLWDGSSSLAAYRVALQETIGSERGLPREIEGSSVLSSKEDPALGGQR